MLPYLIIGLTAFATSFLSLFSGFGLSTVLMPVFAIFFPLPVSVAATAIIHLINNIFKAMLVGKYAEKSTVLRFGIPAAFAAIIGAYLGTRFMEKMTFKSLQMIVGIMLMTLGLGMVMGFIQSS